MLKEHLSKLREYVDKSRNFRLEEWSSYDIENFVNLANQVVKERSTEEGAWELLFLAKTILALVNWEHEDNQEFDNFCNSNIISCC